MYSRAVLAVWVAATLLTITTTTRAEEHHHPPKHVPSGFTGVRGKKSVSPALIEYPMEPQQDQQQLLPDTQLLVVDNKRAVPSGFVGMRGKKPWEGVYEGEDKRRPSGFVGMRGKKVPDDSYYYPGDDASFFYKRAPTGFVGMRGKKYEGLEEEKRIPRLGFVGMRGKKELVENELEDPFLQDDYEEAMDKRVPSSGFFGMRGKKAPNRQMGFFGMRGKKFPYDLRGKFVGVRGKKMDESRSSNGEDLDFNQLMLLLTDEQNSNNVGQFREM